MIWSAIEDALFGREPRGIGFWGWSYIVVHVLFALFCIVGFAASLTVGDELSARLVAAEAARIAQ